MREKETETDKKAPKLLSQCCGEPGTSVEKFLGSKTKHRETKRESTIARPSESESERGNANWCRKVVKCVKSAEKKINLKNCVCIQSNGKNTRMNEDFVESQIGKFQSVEK